MTKIGKKGREKRDFCVIFGGRFFFSNKLFSFWYSIRFVHFVVTKIAILSASI